MSKWIIGHITADWSNMSDEEKKKLFEAFQSIADHLNKITCEICSRIIKEEAHYCEISDCPHRNKETE